MRAARRAAGGQAKSAGGCPPFSTTAVCKHSWKPPPASIISAIRSTANGNRKRIRAARAAARSSIPFGLSRTYRSAITEPRMPPRPHLPISPNNPVMVSPTSTASMMATAITSAPVHGSGSRAIGSAISSFFTSVVAKRFTSPTSSSIYEALADGPLQTAAHRSAIGATRTQLSATARFPRARRAPSRPTRSRTRR